MIEKRQFKKGEVLLSEGDLGETAFIIEAGSVEVTQRIGDRDVHLATLGPGQTCGEMSLVDDRPRSATVTAIEATQVSQINHDEFYETLQTHPTLAIDLLRSLFERLRDADATILRLRRGTDEPAGTQPASPRVSLPRVSIDGRTDEARSALPDGAVAIERFPFRIGRRSHNPLVHNDLELNDSMPWQVSRHHVAVIVQDGRVGVVDRGSRLGCEVDGRRIGGRTGDPGPVFFDGIQGKLVLGQEDSLIQFTLVAERR